MCAELDPPTSITHIANISFIKFLDKDMENRKAMVAASHKLLHEHSEAIQSESGELVLRYGTLQDMQEAMDANVLDMYLPSIELQHQVSSSSLDNPLRFSGRLITDHMTAVVLTGPFSIRQDPVSCARLEETAGLSPRISPYTWASSCVTVCNFFWTMLYGHGSTNCLVVGRGMG